MIVLEKTNMECFYTVSCLYELFLPKPEYSLAFLKYTNSMSLLTSFNRPLVLAETYSSLIKKKNKVFNPTNPNCLKTQFYNFKMQFKCCSHYLSGLKQLVLLRCYRLAFVALVGKKYQT